jgi:hypothetical protein
MYDDSAGVCLPPPAAETSSSPAPAQAPAQLPGVLPGARSVGPLLIAARDANLRVQNYVEPARALAERAWREYQAGELSHIEARDLASNGRTEMLRDTRRQLSPGARAMSEAIREEGHSVEALTRRYALQLLESNPAARARYGVTVIDAARPEVQAAVRQLQNTEEVSQMVIQAAGRPNATMTGVARTVRIVAPIAAATGVLSSTYEVLTAERGQRAWTAGREGASFAGGTLGSMAGGMAAAWTASLVCGPGAPACALIISLVIGGAAAYGGSRLATWAYDAAVPRDAFSALPDAEDVVTSTPMIAGPQVSLGASGGFGGAMRRDQDEFFRQARTRRDNSSGGAAWFPSVDPNPGPTCQ